jgi:hypothetical protein
MTWMTVLGLGLIIGSALVLVVTYARNRNRTRGQIPWDAAGALITVLVAVGAALIAVDQTGNDEPGPIFTGQTSPPTTSTAATPASVEITWDDPRNGATVENCLTVRGRIPQGLPDDHTIVIGDRGVTGDHWAFRYGGILFGANRTTWESSWTLGSLTNPRAGKYSLIAIAMSSEQARTFAAEAREGGDSWESAGVPTDGVIGTSTITVNRRFTQEKC